LGGDWPYAHSPRGQRGGAQVLDAHGQVSVAPCCARWRRTGDGRQALVELKAVDGAYPLYGAVALEPAVPLAHALASRDGAFGAAVDATLLARLDLKPGSAAHVGNATIEVAATLQNEPDKLASGLAFGPA